MPLTQDQVRSLTAHYESQRQVYIGIAGRLNRFITEEMERSARQCLVSHRAKSSSSVMGKLTRYRRTYDYEKLKRSFMPEFEDLAGARVLVYSPRYVDVVVADLERAFRSAGHAVRPKRRDQDKARYSAFHLYVSGRGEVFDGPTELDDTLTVEIQVCTLANHLWNELAHDIDYKKDAGVPDDAQTDLLQVLRQQVELVLFTIGKLEERTEARVQKSEAVITSHAELGIHLMSRSNSASPVSGDVRGLFDLLNALIDPLDYKSLDTCFAEGLNKPEVGRVLEALTERVRDPNHVERILVTLLPRLDPRSVIDVADSNDEPSPFLSFARNAAEVLLSGKAGVSI